MIDDIDTMTPKEIMVWFRNNKRLTIQEVADKIGVSYATMQKYESEPRTMSIEVFDKLNQIYGDRFATIFFKKKLYKLYSE